MRSTRAAWSAADLDQTKVDMTDWQDYVRESQNSLRTIAELTGGIAVVNRTTSKALDRIDGETATTTS